MALEQDIANLVQAANGLTGVVDNKIQTIDTRMDSAEDEFQNWMNTRHIGFSLVDTLLDHSDSSNSRCPL